MNIIYEDNHIIVVNKPINVPTQEDDSKDEDMLTIIKKYLKEKYNKPNNVYLGLVHRLDRPVSGVMVFAKTSKAASRLSEQIRTNKFQKEYLAVVEGKLDKQGVYEDYLLKDTQTNITKINPNGKKAILNYELLEYKDGYSLTKITLRTGRSHQIRVQFSSRNHPLYGDQKYNKNAKTKEQIALFAYKLGFYHPITKEWLMFDASIPKTYPWNIYKLGGIK